MVTADDSNLAYENTSDYCIFEDDARALLGHRYFDKARWLKRHSGVFSGIQWLPVFPWSVDVLNQPCPFFGRGRLIIAETHVAFLGLPWLGAEPYTLTRMARIRSEAFNKNWRGEINDPIFGELECCELRWYLMPAFLVSPVSPGNIQEQLDNLPPEYELTSLAVATTKRIYMDQSSFAPPEGYVGRCFDRSPIAPHSHLGIRVDRRKISYVSVPDDSRVENVTLSVTRRLTL